MYDISYSSKSIRCTLEFLNWVKKLDRSVRIRIDQRIQRLAHGNTGLHKRFDNILEIKWKTGLMGSFRIYCVESNGFILLLGGDKSSQKSDIRKVKQLILGVSSGKIRVQTYE